MKKWTKTIAIAGQVLGMFLGASENSFHGIHGINDIAFLFGVGIPFAITGGIIGLIVDYFVRLLPNDETHVKCPDCRELIIKDARKCKHCGCNLIPQ